MGQTSLFIYRSEIVGYYTLCCATLRLNTQEKKNAKLEEIQFQQIPAIKIGQFAVEKNYQRLGVGTEMIRVAIAEARKYCRKAGCRFIIVDAHNEERVISFYETNDFVKNEGSKSTKSVTISMRFDLWNG